MKKEVVSLVVACVLATTVVSLVACSGGESSSAPVVPDSEKIEPNLREQEPASPSPSIDAFTISVNRDSDPLRRRDAHSGWITIDEEIVAAIANDQGFKVKTDDTYESFDVAREALVAGSIDGIASTSITEENRDAFDFTEPCFEIDGVSYGIAVAKGQNEELIQMFNAGLDNVRNSGRYQSILDKYAD